MPESSFETPWKGNTEGFNKKPLKTKQTYVEDTTQPIQHNQRKNSSDEKNSIWLTALISVFAVLVSFIALSSVWNLKSDKFATDMALVNQVAQIKTDSDNRISVLENKITDLKMKINDVESSEKIKKMNEIDSMMLDPDIKSYMERKLAPESMSEIQQ